MASRKKAIPALQLSRSQQLRYHHFSSWTKKSHRVLFHHFVTCYDQRLQQKPSMVRALQPASLPFRQIVLWGDPEMKESLFTATLPSQASCQVLRNLYLTCIFEYLGTLTSPCMYIQGVRTSWGH